VELSAGSFKVESVVSWKWISIIDLNHYCIIVQSTGYREWLTILRFYSQALINVARQIIDSQTTISIPFLIAIKAWHYFGKITLKRFIYVWHSQWNREVCRHPPRRCCIFLARSKIFLTDRLSVMVMYGETDGCTDAQTDRHWDRQKQIEVLIYMWTDRQQYS